MPSSAFFPTEAISKSRKIIGVELNALYEGTYFTATHEVTVGTGTAVTVLVQTPAASTEKYIHFVCGVEANKGTTWTFSEAPDASGGSALTAANNNRLSTITNPATLTHTVTYVSAGTILETHITSSSSALQSKLGGGIGAKNEWILAADTLYLIRAVAAEADTNIVVVAPFYYRVH